MAAPPTALTRLPHTDLQVPHTRFGMRKIKTLATSDGEAYTAELLLDGKPVGLIENTGTGGSTTWFPLNRDVLDWAGMTAFADQCRDERGDLLHEEFVLASLFDEFRTARDVARWVKQDRTVVRTLSALLSHGDVVDCTFADSIYSIPNGRIPSRAALADSMWRQKPNAHDIQVWTGQRWEPLPKQTRVLLTDGRTVLVPAASADSFQGLDADGLKVYTDCGITYAVTACCDASGKGSNVDSGVVCRSCYKEVDSYFGGPAVVVTPKVVR